MADEVMARIDRLGVELARAAARRSSDYLRQALAGGAYVYGAGSFGRRVVRQLEAQGFGCIGIVDRNANGLAASLGGIPVLHPDMLDKELCAGRVLIVGVFNPFNDLGEIVRAMRPLGFAEIFWGADLPDALGSSFNDFWLSGRAPLVEAFASIRETYARLADEASRKTFESVLRFRALDGDQPDPVPDLVTQYLPPDLPPFDGPISFLDGGAYDGDTYRSLRAGGVDIAAWHAFEPDPDNFTKLASFAADCGGALSLIPCGLAARTGQVHFSAGRDTGSRITAEADATIAIQCMAIDEAFINVPFDYVKLDIEGAELSALDGMRGMIARYKPRLAVSAYHRPEDLWEIPSKLKALLPGSDIYMRQHQRNTFEIVAYAVVANR